MVEAAQIQELHEMEAQLHQVYRSTATIANRQQTVQTLTMVMDSLCELGGSPSCIHTPLQRRLTETVEASRKLRKMIDTNSQAMKVLDRKVSAQQQLVDAKGGLAGSQMAVRLDAECSDLNHCLDSNNANLATMAATFQHEAAREATAIDRLEKSGKLQPRAARVKNVKQVTVVGVRTKNTLKAVPPTPYPTAPPADPPSPSPSALLISGRLGDASPSRTKLDHHEIKHAALLRDIKKQDSVNRIYADSRTNSRGVVLVEIRQGGNSPELGDSTQEEPPPASPVQPRAQSPDNSKLRATSPNSARRFASKAKYVPPTLKATTQAISAANAFAGIAAGGMMKPKQLELDMDVEPEPEQEPVATRQGDQLRKMLDGHSISEAVKAVQDGTELTMYLATGKKKHNRFFWVRHSAGTHQLCWGKKKGTSKHKTATLRAILPEPEITSAQQLFREFDKDNSGEIDAGEFPKLYERARGEKLPKAHLKKALALMDADGSNTISYREFEAWWSDNGGDLERYRRQAFTIKAGDITLLLVAKRSPWESSRNAWVIGCGELLGGSTQAEEAIPVETTALNATEHPYDQAQQQEEQHHNEEQSRPLDQTLEGHHERLGGAPHAHIHVHGYTPASAREADVEEYEPDPGQDDDVLAWYEEVGNVLWYQYEVDGEQDDRGQPPVVIYEDLLTGNILDLTQHPEPEVFWNWDDEDNCFFTNDATARVQEMDADLRPYF